MICCVLIRRLIVGFTREKHLLGLNRKFTWGTKRKILGIIICGSTIALSIGEET